MANVEENVRFQDCFVLDLSTHIVISYCVIFLQLLTVGCDHFKLTFNLNLIAFFKILIIATRD